MQTIKWGPGLWTSIHCMSFNYPEKPSEEDKKLYSTFFNLLGEMLPCVYCRKSYKTYIKNKVKPMLFCTFHPSEWEGLDNDYIYFVKLLKDIKLLFMIEDFHKRRIISALPLIINKHNLDINIHIHHPSKNLYNEFSEYKFKNSDISYYFEHYDSNMKLIKEFEYDFILIALMDEDISNKTFTKLVEEYGVDKNKIIQLQDEIIHLRDVNNQFNNDVVGEKTLASVLNTDATTSVFTRTLQPSRIQALPAA